MIPRTSQPEFRVSIVAAEITEFIPGPGRHHTKEWLPADGQGLTPLAADGAGDQPGSCASPGPPRTPGVKGGQAAMTSDPRTRAGDEDRERTATALGGHYAAGRLTLEEFQQRLDRAYAAKTLGELDDLMTDLPGSDLSPFPGQRDGRPPLPQRRAPGPVQVVGGRSGVRQFWLAVTITAMVVWLIGGAAGGPWLLWLAMPLAFIMLRCWVLGGSGRDRDHRHHG